MVNYALRLSVPKQLTGVDLRHTFYWTAKGPSSFEGGAGPRLNELGMVRSENVDFVRLALLIIAADRTSPRGGGGSNWSQRNFSLRVPTSNPEPWKEIADDLGELVGFLTGDRWSIEFYLARPPREPERQPKLTTTPERVVLLSGGADSAIGALLSKSQLTADESHVLVSHIGAKNLAPIQHNAAKAIDTLIPSGGQQHIQIGLRRRSRQLNDVAFQNEYSSRSRSLLFVSLGLAVASIHGVPLWMPENGFASVNPPLSPNRRGSLSTRTTHPRFLGELSQLLAKVGAHFMIFNPFLDKTKGEMFALVADMVGTDEAAKFLSATHSCGLTGQRAFGISASVQCGVCFGCAVRRASFRAAGLTDQTTYIATGQGDRIDAWLSKNSVETPMRHFAHRGVGARDLVTLSLPSSYSIAKASDLCDRACNELKMYLR